MNAAPMTRRSVLLVALGSTPMAAIGQTPAEKPPLRIGHFPNITHVQGLVAHNMTRTGKGWFEPRLGGTPIEWFVYNAGPSAMEAFFANTLDLTYVGPSPAINAYARARGEIVRIIAGAAEGGAALVVPADSALRTPADFRGRRIATPQLGNTQDVAARAWLTAGGLRITLTGGDAQVIPTANPDQLALFKSRRIDAVWTVEPWVSRLEAEADGKILIEERDSVTTVLTANTRFLDRQRDLARRFVAAHQELTEWIRANPDLAQTMVRDELAAETRTEIRPELIRRAWERIILTADVSRPPLDLFVSKAREAGFLPNMPDLSRLIEKL